MGYRGKGRGMAMGQHWLFSLFNETHRWLSRPKLTAVKGGRPVESRSHEWVKSDINSTPSRHIQTQMHSNVSNNILLAIQLFHTCVHALGCTNYLLFHQPPGLTAANSLLLTVVKTHTDRLRITFPSTVAKKYQSQFIIHLAWMTVALISEIR